MTKLIRGLEEIAAGRRALLCDLWGCYHDGIAPYPAAIEALRRFRAGGGHVLLLTNAPRPIPGVMRFLEKIKAPEDSYDAVLSSGEVCLAAIRSGRHGNRFHYIGPDRDLMTLEAAGLGPVPVEEAEAILCTGLFDDRTETPQDYAEACTGWAARSLPLLCANPDIVVDRGHERLWCAGALAREYERAGGDVVYFGKPHPAVYEAAFAKLRQIVGARLALDEVLAVGDGVQTDIAGAAAVGIPSVFVTGGIAAAEFGSDPLRPDPEQLQAFLDREGQSPDFAIPRLA